MIFQDIEELSPAIQAAATTVAFFHPEYAPAECLVADITLWVMDYDLTEDILSFELFGERVWWLMAVALKLVKQGHAEYNNHIMGKDSCGC